MKKRRGIHKHSAQGQQQLQHAAYNKFYTLNNVCPVISCAKVMKSSRGLSQHIKKAHSKVQPSEMIDYIFSDMPEQHQPQSAEVFELDMERNPEGFYQILLICSDPL